MKLYLNIPAIVLMMVMFLGSCKKDKSIQLESLPKTVEFPHEVTDPGSIVELGSVINIERWSLEGDNLLCLSSDTDSVFYRFNGNTFQNEGSFGVRGQGPGEFLIPTIVESTSGNPLIFDNSTKTIYTLNGKETIKKIVIPEENINLPYLIGEKNIGFIGLRGDSRVLLIKDLTSGETVDSIEFNRDGIEDENIVNEIHYSAYKNHFVVGREFMDRIVVGEIDNNGLIKDIKRYEGKGHLSPTQPYYVDVDCGENNFYLLSMGKMDFSDMDNPKGAPEIQIYDYNGKPQMKFVLDFFPRKMLVDEKRKRLLLLSAEDDNLHILKLE